MDKSFWGIGFKPMTPVYLMCTMSLTTRVEYMGLCNGKSIEFNGPDTLAGREAQ
jgi:hypothetical protein